MYQRLILTVTTAVGLTVLFGVYTLIMRPIVVIPARAPLHLEVSRDGSEEMPEEYKRVAKTYIPEQAWAEAAPQGLRADNAFIFTNDWRRDESNHKRVHFSKFAMVWLVTGPDGKEDAYSIVSDSVQLEFDSEMDERKLKNPGRVVKATFEDNVQIRGPNGLKIEGRNFYFDESTLQLSSTSPVDFWFQSHRGYATKMRIKFLPGRGAPRQDRPHLYAVESVRLIGGPNPVDPNLPFVILKSEIPRGETTVPAAVRCAGDLVYTVATNTVVLNEDVFAQIGRLKTKSTILECGRMTVDLVPAAGAPTTANPPAANPDDFQVPNTRLEFSRFLAEGTNGNRLRIWSTEYGVNAEMNRLEYSVNTQIVTMLADNSQKISDNPQNSVVIKRGPSVLTCPRVDVQMERSSNVETSFESFLCMGKGNFRFFDDQSKELKFEARWRKHLSLKKDEQTSLTVIELDEEALFIQKSRNTVLGANQIKVWLANLNLTGGDSTFEKGNHPARPGTEPEPRRMLALGNVGMISPQFHIDETKELDVLIEEGDPRPISQPTTQIQRLPQVTVSNRSSIVSNEQKQPVAKPGIHIKPISTKRRTQGFASVPAEADQSTDRDVQNSSEPTSKSNRSSAAKPSVSAEPIKVRANRISARMFRIPDTQEIKPRALHAEGSVKVSQTGKAGGTVLFLDGDIVDMNSKIDNGEVIHVVGQPALIKAQNYRIEGRDINLDRQANRAWVDGPGNLTLPLPAQSTVQGLEGAANRDIRVTWNESMDFDGLQARFIRGIRAVSGSMVMSCEQMFVEMVSRVSFQSVDLQSPQSKEKNSTPELKTIRCQENVKFESFTRAGNRQTKLYRGAVGEFSLNYITGKVDAQGPGKIQVWERQEKADSGLATQDTIQANHAIPAEVTLWDYTLFEFEGMMKGTADMTGRSGTPRNMVFDDRVRVTRGPVERQNEVVDPDKLPPMGLSIRCNKLKVAQHPKSKRNPRDYFELIGIGNAELEGRVGKDRFQASGDEMSYDGANGNYTLRANGHRSAMIRGMFNQSAQLIEFNPGEPELGNRSIRVSGGTEGHAGKF